jgi:tryptophan 2,3-dioxygenase
MMACPSERAAAAEAEAGISLGAASIAFGSGPGYLAAARQGALPKQDRGPVLPGLGASDYERYLHTGELLALQKAVEVRAHRDELLFQVTHQTAELWLKLADDELREATACLRRDAVTAGTRLLGRSSLCLRLVIDGMAMLERMSPWDYSAIRPNLGHGSGFTSPGFIVVRKATKMLDKEWNRLLERRQVALADVYRDPAHFDLYCAAEAMIEWDERLLTWRDQHVRTVIRLIGRGARGTQGTPVEQLAKLRDQEAFPALWEVRNELSPAHRQ